MIRLLPLAALALAAAGCSRKPAPILAGGEIYATRCAMCHGRVGEGTSGLYPALTKSEIVTGPPERFAALVLDGMRGDGPGAHGEGAIMPGWRDYLQDAEIAAVATFVRGWKGATPVTPMDVNRVRLQTQGHNLFWSRGELHALRLQ